MPNPRHPARLAALALAIAVAAVTACSGPSSSDVALATLEYTDSDGYSFRIDLVDASIDLHPDVEHSKPGEAMIPYELKVNGRVENLTADRTADVRFSGATAMPLWPKDSAACRTIDANADWNALSELVDTAEFCAPLGSPGVDLRWGWGAFTQDEAEPGETVELGGDFDSHENGAVVYGEADFDEALQALEQPERWILVK